MGFLLFAAVLGQAARAEAADPSEPALLSSGPSPVHSCEPPPERSNVIEVQREDDTVGTGERGEIGGTCTEQPSACGAESEMSFAIDLAPLPADEPPLTHPDPPSLVPPSAMSTEEAIRAIFGLLILFALAYVGGHPRVRRFERRIGVAQLVTAGFPFILLGLIGRSQDILSDPVLDAIRPLLPLGLGWIGFAIGFRFDIRIFENFPRVILEAFVLTTLFPFALIVGAAAIMLALIEGMTADAAFARDALVLATAGAMTSRTVVTLLVRRNASAAKIAHVQRLIQLEELAAFMGLLLLGAFFRSKVSVGWQLPSVGWIFVTVGVGALLGVVIFAALRTLRGATETVAVMLGSICLAAGTAGFLRLSPIVVCFLAGALLVNLSGPWKDRVRAALLRLERPVYLLFLVLAGAMWRADQWEAWVLMVFFVAARLGGRFAGVRIFARRYPDALGPIEQRHLAASPMGALSVAIVISAQVLYSGATVPWIVHAILMGAVVTEVVVHLFALKPRLMTGFFPAFTLLGPPLPPAEPAPAPPDHTPTEEVSG